MLTEQIISLIEAEARRRNIAPATLCRRAVGNNRVYRNLTAGGSVTLEVADRLMRWVDDNPVPAKDAAA